MQRSESVELIKADLLNTPSLRQVIESATGRWSSLDVLVNNAVAFYPTPLGSIQKSGWGEFDAFMGAPFSREFEWYL